MLIYKGERNMDNKRKTNLDKLKLIKSAIGMGVILSTSACGQYETDKNEEGLQTSIEQLDDVVLNEDATISEFVQEVLGTEASSKQTTTTASKETTDKKEQVDFAQNDDKNDLAQNNGISTKSVASTNKVETKPAATNNNEETKVSATNGKGNTTDKKDPISNIGDSGIKYPSNNKTQKPDINEHVSEENKKPVVTTAKETAKKPVVTTTKKTTKKPVVTTTVKVEPVTEPPKVDPVEPPIYEDYSLNDITWSADAFNEYADKLNQDLYQGSMWTGIDGELHDGWRECRLALAVLNNEQINEEVLASVFADYSDDEIYSARNYIYGICSAQEVFQSEIDFNNYVIDEEIGNFLNEMDNAYEDGEIDNFMTNKFWNGEAGERLMDSLTVWAVGAGYDVNNIAFNESDVDYYYMNDYIDNLKAMKGKSYTR